jgi:hypothetical protein
MQFAIGNLDGQLPWKCHFENIFGRLIVDPGTVDSLDHRSEVVGTIFLFCHRLHCCDKEAIADRSLRYFLPVWIDSVYVVRKIGFAIAVVFQIPGLNAIRLICSVWLRGVDELEPSETVICSTRLSARLHVQQDLAQPIR